MLDECPTCKTRLQITNTVTTLHFTGDERMITLWDCPGCGRAWLDDSVDAWLQRGTEHVARAFGPLDPADRERVAKAFAACPAPARKGCRCGADDIADEVITRLAQISLHVGPLRPL